MTTSPDPTVDERIIANQGLVRSVVHSMPLVLRPAWGYEDALSAGNIGLVLAARKYDQTRGVPWGSYAYTMIRRTVIDAMRKATGVYGRKRLAPPPPVYLGTKLRGQREGATLSDLIPSDEEMGEDVVRRTDTARLLTGLNPQENEVVQLLYWQDQDISVYTEAHGVSRRRGNQIRERALFKMRQKIDAYGGRIAA